MTTSLTTEPKSITDRRAVAPDWDKAVGAERLRIALVGCAEEKVGEVSAFGSDVGLLRAARRVQTVRDQLFDARPVDLVAPKCQARTCSCPSQQYKK